MTRTLFHARKCWLVCAFLAVLCIGLVSLVPAGALEACRVSQHWVDPASGLALGGFDPVTYFAGETPRQGSRRHEAVWAGKSWRFVDQGNKAAFERAPETYAPRYGGHGALAMAIGNINRGDPLIWLRYEGKLYFFHSAEARDDWSDTALYNITRGDRNWKRFCNGEYD